MNDSVVQENVIRLKPHKGVALAVGVTIVSLICLLGLFGPARAQSIIDSPDAPGTISGKVTNAQGAPLTGINIYICNNRYYYCDVNSDEPARFVTQADGTYKVTGLAPGIYQLQFVDPQHVYASEFYENANELSAATGIPVSGNNIKDINVTLELGGSISGSITGITGTTLSNVYVSLYLSSTNPLLGLQSSLLNQYLEFGETEYTIGGLAAGTYYICASAYLEDDSSATYVTECYDNIVSSTEDLTPIPVVSGQTTAAINLVLGENPAYAQLSGRIMASNGEPVPFAVVTAVAGQDDAYGNYVSTNSDANGYYTFTTVISDTYTVLASEYQNYGNFITYYGNVDNRADATYFSLQNGEIKTGVDITMLDGGVIQGHIELQDELGLQYGTVTVYQFYPDYYGSDSGAWYALRDVAVDPQTSGYILRGLPDGTYRLSFSGSYGGISFSQFYTEDGSEVFSVDEASDIVLSSPDPSATIDFVFATKLFEGSIEGLVGADGQPLAGIRVDLYDGYGFGYYGQPSIVYTFTDAKGYYRFDGLNDNYYSVSFADPAGKYASTFYGDIYDTKGDSSIPVFEGDKVSGINITLATGGSIAGVVKGPNGQPLANVVVNVYTQQPFGLFPFPMPIPVKTDQSGAYTVNGLGTGVYKVCFQDARYVFPYLCYGGASYPEDGRDVAVTADATKSGINLTLGTPDFPNKLYLPLASK
ncbi:MAG: carboxypeptidase regulatory-like domain-containing protein [Caldilineaceae bacterium]|nr:carboxypeptidase regulatory-like domain-containing protein [Caldilineaceae bacterium]